MNTLQQSINKRSIVIDGCDGMGKTYQFNQIVEYINLNANISWEATYIKELNDTNIIFKNIRNLVYRLYDLVDVVTLAELIKINRYLVQLHLNEDRVKKSLFNYNFIDRWNISTYCYLKASGFEKEALHYLYDYHTEIPGLTILLVGYNGVNRLKNRLENNNMFEDRDIEFSRKLAQCYIDFDDSIYIGKVIKINNDNLSKEETELIIREEVLSYLNHTDNINNF